MTGETFLSLVRQSGLLDPEVLKRHLKELQEGGNDLGEGTAVANALVQRQALTRWQADKILVGKHKGFFLGKYRLMSHLGKGGMSSVYLAEHVLMRRRVAIKVLPQARVEDSSYLQRFHREAQAVAALDHRNIVRAYDVDQEGSVHFLVMEYVPGQSLQELIAKRGVLSPVVAAEYIRQAAEGLAAAHKAGLVHRDIKPGNLLVDDRGTVKLLDLGLARFSTEDSETASLTIAHDEKVLGTADYLAPEQALDSHLVDSRADLYSLGGTLYFLMTGHPPFPEGTVTQRLLAHQTREPVSLRIKRPDVPEAFVAILEKLMKKNPDDRFQSAKEASAAMFQWLAQNGGDAWMKMSNSATLSTSPTTHVGDSSGVRPASGSSPAVGQSSSSVLALSKEQDEPSGGSTAIRPQKGLSTPVPKAPTLEINPSVPASPATGTAPLPATKSASDSGGFNDFSFLEKPAAPSPSGKSGAIPAVPPKSGVSTTPSQPSRTAVTTSAVAATATPGDAPTVDLSRTTADKPAAPAIPVAPQLLAPAATPSGMAPPPSKAPVAMTPATPPSIKQPPEPGSPATGNVKTAPVGPFDFLQSPGLVETAAFDLGALGTSPTAQPEVVAPTPSVEAKTGEAKPVKTAAPVTAKVPVAKPVTAPLAKPVKPAIPVAASAVPATAKAALPETPAPISPVSVAAAAGAGPVGVPSASDALAGFPGLPTEMPVAQPPLAEGLTFPVMDDAPVFAPTSPESLAPAADAPPVSKPASKAGKPGGMSALPWKGISIGGVVAIGLLYGLSLFTAAPTKGQKKPRKSTDSSETAESTEPTSGTGGPSLAGFKPTRELKVGPGQPFPDLAAALAEVKKEYGQFKAAFDDSRRSGRLIRLTSADGINQPIVIDGSLPNGLRIIADPSLGVSVSSSGSGPLLTIQGRERVVVDGLILDANGKTDAIRLVGQLSGLHLKNIVANGFTKTGISGEGILGYPGDREILLIESVTLRSGGPDAIGLSLKKGDEPPAYLRVEKSMFSGPMQAGVATNGGLTEVEFRGNIFSDAKTGIRIEGDALRHRDLTFAYNSFHLGETGIRFTNMPAADSAGLGFYNNLFVGQTGPAVLIEKDFKVDDFLRMYSKNAGGAVNNWTDADKPSTPATGVLMLFEAAGRWAAKDVAFQSTDPSSGNYLKPAPGSPQANVGRPNIKAYTAAQVGAKAP
jgi:serine/threonine protein kinase